MQAIIKRIELKKFFKKYYFLVELQDENGKIHIVDKPFSASESNFRKQLFGLMAACNQFDLLKLCTDSPVYKNVIGYYSNGLQILENDENKWFSYDKKKGTYFCENCDKNIKRLFDFAIERKVRDVSVTKGKIESIESGSGVFQIFFKGDSLGTFMNTGQIYYGFGYPIGLGDSKDIEGVRKAVVSFQSFIINLLKFYNVSDILDLGGKKDIFPVVDISLEKGKVVSITSLDTGMGIILDNNFEIINCFEKENKKALK